MSDISGYIGWDRLPWDTFPWGAWDYLDVDPTTVTTYVDVSAGPIRWGVFDWGTFPWGSTAGPWLDVSRESPGVWGKTWGDPWGETPISTTWELTDS